MKPRFKLRLVAAADRPLAKLSHAEKLVRAKAILRRSGKYILDRGTPKPKWGVPGEIQLPPYRDTYHGMPPLFKRIADRFRSAWRGR